MKKTTSIAALSLALLTAAPAQAAALAQSAVWHPNTFLQAVGSTVVFGFVGIVLAIAGFKLFDLFTPYDLAKEICKEKNLAVGVLGAGIVIGVCYVVATAIS